LNALVGHLDLKRAWAVGGYPQPSGFDPPW
jgi:hypothetical protein